MGTKAIGIYFRGTTPLDRLIKSARSIILFLRLQDEIRQLLSKPRFQPVTRYLWLRGLNRLRMSLHSLLMRNAPMVHPSIPLQGRQVVQIQLHHSPPYRQGPFDPVQSQRF